MPACTDSRPDFIRGFGSEEGPSHLWRSVILAWASLGKLISADAPELRPKAFTFTLLPDIPQFPQSQPPSTPLPRSSSPPHATVVAEPIRAQHGREKRQCSSSVGSITASDVSGDGGVVMTSFEFPQESPTCKSAPLSPAQRPASHTGSRLLPSSLNGFGCSLRLSAMSITCHSVAISRIVHEANQGARILPVKKIGIFPPRFTLTLSSITGTTSWQFESIHDTASSEYKKKTGNGHLGLARQETATRRGHHSTCIRGDALDKFPRVQIFPDRFEVLHHDDNKVERKLAGRADIEEALKRLDGLTQEKVQLSGLEGHQ
ncbi:hypothetical protein EDB92DRAFT_2100596 [Lactarius akahatsu]|uniref:Uncharacterized protein n=1 Tax=Lactarius akahatsu TaxID=416441 RepID=A0AAD4QCB1_9AGAM|nr:hypothetical protein EDB92DRAFT_2100596 [Lactarius akahatsu]